MTELSNEETLHNELELFSFTHDMVGGQLLEKWLFPVNLITAVAYHHRPGETSKEATFAYIVQLADILSFYSCNPERLNEENILTRVQKALPKIEQKWQAVGLNLSDEAVENWYEWLLLNREEGNSIRDIVIQ